MPPSVSPPGLFASATVTPPAKVGSTFPNGSSAEITKLNPTPGPPWKGAGSSPPVEWPLRARQR